MPGTRGRGIWKVGVSPGLGGCTPGFGMASMPYLGDLVYNSEKTGYSDGGRV